MNAHWLILRKMPATQDNNDKIPLPLRTSQLVIYAISQADNKGVAPHSLYMYWFIQNSSSFSGHFISACFATFTSNITSFSPAGAVLLLDDNTLGGRGHVKNT